MSDSVIKFGSKTSGLGDILLLTSICKYSPMKFTIQLPPEQERFSCLFEGLANVEITEDITTLEDIGTGHYATRKLRGLFEGADLLDNRPLVLYSDPESEAWAINYLVKECAGKPAVIFQTDCSPQWRHVRAIPESISSQIKEQLTAQGVAIIDASKMTDLDLKKYICLMRKVGRYVGPNTGDFHLAVSVGAMCNVYEPQNNQFFQDYEWNYRHPSISYGKYEIESGMR